MEYRWQNKNIDVKPVASDAEQFLTKRSFIVSKEETEDTVKLVGFCRNEEHETKRVIITVSKMQRDFSVKIEASEDLQPILKYGSLIHFLGGGLILSKKLKAAEFYQKIENEFLAEIDEIVANHDVSR